MKAQISVIIPAYNVKDYLQEAVDSIIKQKEFLHEIIIVDDGSTDGTGDLIDKLSSNVDYIKAIHKKNEGQGVARNWGTDICTGNFIYYFDSDDLLKGGLFEKFCYELSQNPDLEIFCFSGENFLDKNYSFEEVNDKNLLSYEAKRKIEAVCNSGEEAFNLLATNNSFYVYTWLYIFKKDILTKYNISFKAIRNEDGEFINNLFIHAAKTVINGSIYVKHRIRAASTMEVHRSFKDIFGILKTIETLEQLSKLDYLMGKTKILLKNKIIGAVRDVIKIKVSNNMKLSKEEKKIYKNSLRPYIDRDRNLFFFYYTYFFEYRLRKLKERIFN